MQFQRATLQTCDRSQGTVISIDVIRAFTTAAFAFAAGAKEINLVSTIEEAFRLRAQIPDSAIIGEAEGQPVPGFDYWNSPAQLSQVDLGGRPMIQRTSAGTQGVVLSGQAEYRLGASFCVASATARLIQRLGSSQVSFVETGVRSGGWGDEDTACADYLEALVMGRQPDPAPYLERVKNAPWGRIFADPDHPEWPAEDLACCLQVDRFNFAMQVTPEGGRLVLRTVSV